MPSTSNRIRSPRFYRENMTSMEVAATSLSACYLITDCDEGTLEPRVDSTAVQRLLPPHARLAAES